MFVVGGASQRGPADVLTASVKAHRPFRVVSVLHEPLCQLGAHAWSDLLLTKEF
jgi:hypothetical protein